MNLLYPASDDCTGSVLKMTQTMTSSISCGDDRISRINFFFLLYFCIPGLNAISSAGWILHQGFVLLSLMVFVVEYLKWDFEKLRSIWWLIAGMLYYTVAICIGNAVTSSLRIVSFRDLYEIQQPAMLVMTVLWAMSEYIDNKRFWRRLDQTLIKIAVVIVTIGFIQYSKILPGFSILYTKEWMLAKNRLSAPFRNPYDYSFIIGFFSYYFLANGMLGKEKNGKYYLLFAVCVLSLLLSQSRSGLIALLFGLSCVYLGLWRFGDAQLPKKEKIVRKRVILSLIAVLLIVGVLFFAFFEEIALTFKYIANGINILMGDDPSSIGGGRTEQIAFTIDSLLKTPFSLLFGYGPSKNLPILLESVYAGIGFRYGILGLLVLMIAPLLIGIFAGTRNARRSIRQDIKAFSLASAAWFVSAFFSGLSMNFIENARTSIFFIFILTFNLLLSRTTKLSRDGSLRYVHPESK